MADQPNVPVFRVDPATGAITVVSQPTEQKSTQDSVTVQDRFTGENVTIPDPFGGRPRMRPGEVDFENPGPICVDGAAKNREFQANTLAAKAALERMIQALAEESSGLPAVPGHEALGGARSAFVQCIGTLKGALNALRPLL